MAEPRVISRKSKTKTKSKRSSKKKVLTFAPLPSKKGRPIVMTPERKREAIHKAEYESMGNLTLLAQLLGVHSNTLRLHMYDANNKLTKFGRGLKEALRRGKNNYFEGGAGKCKKLINDRINKLIEEGDEAETGELIAATRRFDENTGNIKGVSINNSNSNTQSTEFTVSDIKITIVDPDPALEKELSPTKNPGNTSKHKRDVRHGRKVKAQMLQDGE